MFHLSTLDWIVMGGFLALILVIGLWQGRNSGKSIQNFFLGGRNLPWYIAGASMVATTFGADTPLAVTELVAANGIAGNWLWWNFLAGGLLTTFFFAKLWRRSGVLTEVELIEVRYSGKAASFLRGFKAIYLGVFLNGIVMAWVNLALVSILEVFFDLDKTTALQYTALALVFVAIFSSLSGFLGIAITDMIQFILAMVGCIILAVMVLNEPSVGGVDGLLNKLPASTFEFFPSIGSGDGLTTFSLGIGAFLAYVGIQWWASWYPGAEPGGGGYIAQRMMSTKDEKHAFGATLFFQIAHYCIRPWPWIIVALCSLVLYPELSDADKKLGFVMTIRDHMPSGLKGMLLVAFLAAYMSTMSTQLNFGSSFVINDLYKRFLRPNSEEKELVLASRITTIILMLVSVLVTLQIDQIKNAWSFILECGAGLGLVLILRWYWWRINVWSEIAATVIPFFVYTYCYLNEIAFPESYFWIVGITTISWIAITFMTPPVDDKTLQNFYQRVQPGGWWRHISDSKETGGLRLLTASWLLSLGLVYSILFGTGYLIFGMWHELTITLGLLLSFGAGLYYTIVVKKVLD